VEDPNVVIVEDPILERLDEQARAEDRLYQEMGIESDRAGTAEDDSPVPYDLEPEAPRALSIERLLELNNTQPPPSLKAALGDQRAVLLLHGLTPFHRQGQRPAEIWGLGYAAKLLGCDAARTVSYEPGNHAIKAIEVNQALTVDIALDGRMQIGTPATDAQPLAAGLSGGASMRQGFALALQIEWSALEVQAGPTGAGGVRWNLYRQARRIDRHHRLLQTLLIPRDTKTLTIEIDTWVRRRGGFFGLFATREWRSPTRTYVVNVDDAAL
jgi:hypothetical protein